MVQYGLQLLPKGSTKWRFRNNGARGIHVDTQPLCKKYNSSVKISQNYHSKCSFTKLFSEFDLNFLFQDDANCIFGLIYTLWGEEAGRLPSSNWNLTGEPCHNFPLLQTFACCLFTYIIWNLIFFGTGNMNQCSAMTPDSPHLALV